MIRLNGKTRYPSNSHSSKGTRCLVEMHIQDQPNLCLRKLRCLLELMHVEHQVSLVQALAHFWEVSTATFHLEEHELVPTLEEYQATIEINSKPRVIEPPI